MKKIVLAHSELTNTIYAIVGREKIDITKQAIAEVKAIKALEQEPILDKISEEMFEEMLSHSGTGEEVIQAYADGLKMGLKIIDKYRQG